jgi:tetratricopeptide (TPR) repeat protein
MDKVSDDAIRALELLPDPKATRIFVDFLRDSSFIEAGRAQDALELINANLQSKFMEREDLQDSKYEHLVYKGNSLTRLARCNEALNAFEEAHAMQPSGKHQPDMLIGRSNCLMALKRYEEAYDVASRLAVHSIRIWQFWPCNMWQNAECGKDGFLRH